MVHISCGSFSMLNCGKCGSVSTNYATVQTLIDKREPIEAIPWQRLFFKVFRHMAEVDITQKFGRFALLEDAPSFERHVGQRSLLRKE